MAQGVRGGGGRWTVDAVAAVTAATIAALVAGLAALLTWWSGKATREQAAHLAQTEEKRSRELTGRDQWWSRFTWAIEMITSDSGSKQDVGLAVLVRLLDAPWASRADNEIALAISTMMTTPEPPERTNDV
ncbi:hypothetical protein [Georgenia yuyongxinii]|uniref:Uncharacterized protein n=1 Tax=Georgenia yuyongxinii TaxID=2589797 RepID=A0A552WSV9_9MICO|nr:hypothetical protein [Georgenia yuyongxinii]TRW45902.1 hypothetical protein FJ693_07795 [Georgenia yuyongxinii]